MSAVSVRTRARRTRLGPGDWVEVRSLAEIEATLDAAGALDGLPFMPEMAAFCGRRFRVSRRANRVCMPGHPQRRILDAVFLEDLRCDGARHGGCQMGCALFWKEAWLKRATKGSDRGLPTASTAGPPAPSRLRSSDGTRYVCQATELPKATVALPQWRPWPYLADLRNGNLTPRRFVRGMRMLLDRRMRERFHLAPRAAHRACGKLVGDRGRTPQVTLGLRPGDRVRVRGRDEIAATLDRDGKNRGMEFVGEMHPFLGGTYEVERRVDRIVVEQTGELRELRDTVLLKDVTCDGACIGGCSRFNYLFWREAWLDRPGSRAPSAEPSTPLIRS